MSEIKNAKFAVYIRVGNESQLATNQKKTAFYCRSAIYDDNAIAVQKQRLQKFSDKNGYENPICYADNGASGAKFNRSAFERLMTDIENGNVNCVITVSFARLSRNLIQLKEWLNEMNGMGVRVISLNEGYDSFDTFDTFSELLSVIT